MRKNTIVITPDRHMYIRPLPDKYDAMLDTLHEVADSMKIQIWGSADLGKPYVIVCPAFSEEQAGMAPYNPMATQLVFNNSGGSIYGNVSVAWMDDREGRYTLAGLTDDEAFYVCMELNWTYLGLVWDFQTDDASSEDSICEFSSCMEEYGDSIDADYDSFECYDIEDIDDSELEEYDDEEDEDFEDAYEDNCEDLPWPSNPERNA